VVELKEATIKKSNLSAVARSKVINKSGGNYVSENREGYGPCPSGSSSQGCRQEAKYEVNTILRGDYFLGRCDGEISDVFTVDHGKIKDQDFSRIQKRINEFKSGKLKVYKYTSSSRGYDAPRERNEECIKYEGYFEASLENALKELKEKEHYGLSFCYSFVKP